MQVAFPIVKKGHAVFIWIPKVFEELSCDMIEQCLDVCGGPKLEDVGGAGYVVEDEEPWTERELDYLRQVAERKLTVPTTEGGK